MVGYSRLMEDDEAGTLARLDSMRSDTIDPQVERFGGRIGINLGDIVVEGEDIFGTGVNVAARLEGLADPGGICISGRVFEQVEGKVDTGFEFLGLQTVKNISRPVNAYRVLLDEDQARKVVNTPANTPLPAEPSVAVLPFKDISPGTAESYFADALTKDIITDLSKVSGVFVVASKSALAYKDTDSSPSAITTKLGVRHLLNGSVQRDGDSLRITVRLVDAADSDLLWSERFDGQAGDLLQLQSEIARQVAKALKVTLSATETERLFQKITDNIEAYKTFIKARRTVDAPSRENIDRGELLIREVIALDPEFAGGYAGLSYVYNLKARFRYGNDLAYYRTQALELAHKAIEKDPNFAWSYIALGGAHLANRDPVSAVDAARRALVLEPNGYFANLYLAFYLQFIGEGALAVEHAERAKRMSPVDTVRKLAFLGRAYFVAGEYEKAIEVWEKRFRNFPISSPNGFMYLAACYHLLGDTAKADDAAARLREAFPDFRLSEWGYIKLYKPEEDRARLYDAAIAAGVPE